MNLVKRLLRPFYVPFLRYYRYCADVKRGQEAIRTQVKQAQQSGRALKVIVGAGAPRYEGWIATDLPAFNILKRKHWARLFLPNSIKAMLAEHVIEHLTAEQFQDFLRIARIYLAPGGRIRLAVPDGCHPDPDYIGRVRPGGTGGGADDHKVLYTCDLINDLLAAQGYDCQLLEYYDAAGEFHHEAWHEEDGFVRRSAFHDSRNADGRLVYTSLIVDCRVSSPPPRQITKVLKRLLRLIKRYLETSRVGDDGST